MPDIKNFPEPRLTAWLVVFSLCVWLGLPQVTAQDLTPTAQQLELLQGASQDEINQLLSRQDGVPAVQTPVETVNTVVPRQVEDAGQSEAPGQDVRQRLAIEQQPQQVDQELEPFGYELFAGTPTTFAPATNIPVPSTYIVGPGDTVILQLYGQQNITYQLVVTREGQLMFPEIGPVNVSGLSFEDLRGQLQSIVANQLIGQSASITMGPLRSIDIFVLGEASRPGSYTVSSLSTMTNALFVSGGVTTIGSLRNIRLMRNGQQVTELDLYDLLLRGDTSGDARLQPGDVIFVPPVGRTVGIAGEVRRPAIYELKDEATVAEVLSLSGGLTPTAFPAASRLERINERGERTLIDVDLSDEDGSPALADGDFLRIYPVMDQLESVVLLQGHVQRPGGFGWREGMRVSDVLPDVALMLPDPELEFAFIAREILPARRIELLRVNLGTAISNPGSEADLLLQPRDQINTFGSSRTRVEQLGTFLTQLDEQSSFDHPPLAITVSGNVRFPGRYPLFHGMTLDDAIRFAGGLSANSDLANVLLERRTDLRGSIAVERHEIDSGSLVTPSPVALKELDKILVFNANQPREELLSETLAQLQSQALSGSPTQIVSVDGAVRFPGQYPLIRGLSVGDLVSLAGGFSESANLSRAELAHYNSDPVIGREVSIEGVNLRASGTNGSGQRLQAFDRLVIRQLPNWSAEELVSIGGEVNSPGTYAITPEDTIVSLIQRAGGLTDQADPAGAIFLREALREQEQRRLERAREDLRRELIKQQLQTAAEDDTGLEQVESMLNSLAEVSATGRLVIDLPRLLDGTAAGPDLFALQDGDQLLIPQSRDEVSVTGQVYQPTSHLFREGLDLNDYVNLSGGYQSDADRGAVYVIRSSGEVEPYGGLRWFFQARSRIEHGDTIVVPPDIFRPGSLQTLSSVSQILFNLSTTLLAIQRVGN